MIVEGKYDKITLENVIDALIIPTDGFGIFKNKEKRDLIRLLAQRDGIIVMTDSDSAGSVIRSYIKKIVGDCEIINIYVPCLKGKERRKDTVSKEGLLGVEGMSVEIIAEALKKSGVIGKDINQCKRRITKTDMYFAGLSGTEQSAQRRKTLLRELCLPEVLSPNAMLDVLNTLLTYEEFCEAVERCREEPIKS